MFRRVAVLFIAIAVLTGLMPGGNAAAGDLDGRIIILDAGHGDGGNTYAGYSEGTTMRILADKIKTLLEERGAEVHLTRTTKDATPLAARAAIINITALKAVKDKRLTMLSDGSFETDEDVLKNEINEIDRLIGIMQSIIDDPETNGAIYMNSPYDYSHKRVIHPDLKSIFEFENDPEIRDRFLMISLHSNATPTPVDTSVNGADVYYCSNTFSHNTSYYNDYTYNELEKYFGGLILDEISALGIRKRTISENNWFITREHNVPGVLVEHGFHTNARDRAKLSDDTFLNNLALAYAETVGAYFEYAAPRTPESVPPELPETQEIPELPEQTALYTDVSGDKWFFSAVKFVTENGLLPPGTETAFLPDREIAAKLFSSMLSSLSERTNLTESDNAGDTQNGEDAAWLMSSSHKFRIESAITREEAAVILYDYLRSEQIFLPQTAISIADSENVSVSAREAVTTMLACGIMVGSVDGFFYPNKTITRAEAAQACLNLAALSEKPVLR